MSDLDNNEKIAAAAYAAATMLFPGDVVRVVCISIEGEKTVPVSIEEPVFDIHGVSCCVKSKDCSESVYARVTLDPSEGIHLKECTSIDGIISKDLSIHKVKNSESSALKRIIINNMLTVCNKYKYYGGINVYLFVNKTENAVKKAV